MCFFIAKMRVSDMSLQSIVATKTFFTMLALMFFFIANMKVSDMSLQSAFVSKTFRTMFANVWLQFQMHCIDMYFDFAWYIRGITAVWTFVKHALFNFQVFIGDIDTLCVFVQFLVKSNQDAWKFCSVFISTTYIPSLASRALIRALWRLSACE